MAANKTPFYVYMYGLYTVAAIVTMGVSLGTAYWNNLYHKSRFSGHLGLFKACNEVQCQTYSNAQDFVKETRGLCIAAMCLYGVTLLAIGHLVMVCQLEVKSYNHGFLGLSLSWIASTLAIAAPIHYYKEVGVPGWFSDDTWNYGYSFYCAIASAILAFAAGIFSMIAVYKLYKAQHPPAPVQGFVYPPQTQHVVYNHPPMQQHPGQYPQGYAVQGYPNQGYANQGYSNQVPANQVPANQEFSNEGQKQ